MNEEKMDELRERLNLLIVAVEHDKDAVLKLSQEMDMLIVDCYKKETGCIKR